MEQFYLTQIPIQPKQARIVFVIEDDQLQLQLITDYLKSRYKVDAHGFSSGEEALKKLSLRPDLVFLDYNLDQSGPQAANGIEILKKIKEKSPLAQVIMLSSQDKIAVSVDCMKHGAYDYIVKGESAFKRLENLFGNVDKLMENVYFRKFYKELVTVLVVILCLILGFFMIGIGKGWIVLNF